MTKPGEPEFKNIISTLKHAEEERAENRFQFCLAKLDNGQQDVLQNPEFLERLPNAVFYQYADGQYEKVERRLSMLLQLSLKSDDPALGFSLLHWIWERSIEDENIGMLRILCSAYGSVLPGETPQLCINHTAVYDLLQTVNIFADKRSWEEFEYGIQLLWEISNITWLEDNKIQAPHKNIFSQLRGRDFFEQLLDFYIHGNKERKEIAEKIFSFFGEEVSIHFLNSYLYASSPADEVNWVDILRKFGATSPRLLHNLMEEDLPNSAVLNFIYLITALGVHDNYGMIEGYLLHPDDKIQKEVVNAIFALQGKRTPDNIVHAMPIISDINKLNLISRLASYTDEKIGSALLSLLARRNEFDVDLRDELVNSICAFLKNYPYPLIADKINALITTADAAGNPQDSDMLSTLREVNHSLSPKIRHIRKNIHYSTLFAQNSHEAKESQSKNLINVDYSFPSSDPRPLDENFFDNNDAEVTTIDPVWSTLQDNLTEGEFYSLQDVFLEEKYKAGEIIVSRGDIDPCLYLLFSGSAKITYGSGENETFLKKLIPGQIVGASPFFFSSVWTYTITAMQETVTYALVRERFAKVDNLYPKLEDKLQKIVSVQDDTHYLVTVSVSERRNYPRYTLNLFLTCYLQDHSGSKYLVKYFQGELINISSGGLSFQVKLSDLELNEQLLGQRLVCEIDAADDSDGKLLQVLGTVVAVRKNDTENGYFSVHIHFVDEISPHEIMHLV